MTEKEKKIKKICKLLKSHFEAMGFSDFVVINIYHQKIDSNFCSKYNVDAPLSTFQRNGPHIYMRIGDKIGFGLLVGKLNFNKGLYEKGKYWAELLSPDFIFIFSDHIRNEDFDNYLFQENKEILLNGFKPYCNKKETIKKIPIYLIEINKDFDSFYIKYCSKEFTEIIEFTTPDLKSVSSTYLQEPFYLTDIYILGNLYPFKDEDLTKNQIRLIFNNRVYKKKKTEGARIKLKFFNNIRDLERKLKRVYKNSSFSLKMPPSTSLEVKEVYLDVELREKNPNLLFSKKTLKEVLKKPPIFAKSFIKGFVDKNYFYLSYNYYSGQGAIYKQMLDDEIQEILCKAQISLKKDFITEIGNSCLEVRRSPFVQGKIQLI